MTNGRQVIGELAKGIDPLSNLAAQRQDANRTGIHVSTTEENHATLEIVIVHEDAPTCLRAKQVIERLRAQLEINLHIEERLWTTGMLRDPLLHGHAISEVGKAQILLLSLYGHQELPLAVRDVINHWVAGREADPGTLLISLDENLQDSAAITSMLDDLRTTATSGRVELVTHFGSTPSAAWSLGSQNSQSHHGEQQAFLEVQM